MTREEAKKLFRLDRDAYGKPRGIMKKIDQIYDDFECETIHTSCCKCSTAYQHENAAPFWHTWICEKCGQVNHSISGNFINKTIEDKLNERHNNEIQS